MTLKTSLFNKGVYKSTIRRFYLGSLAYFLLLFMVSCMITFLSDYTWYDNNNSYLLSGGILQVSVIISIAVPTVVALLIYRFVHSKKSSIFVHSLPVCRTANYISSLTAGLSLMTAPIVLNGLILAAMALSGQWPYLIISDCFVWMGINILAVFIMFSYSGICAMLTGNSFAFVGLNILIHCFIPLIVASFGLFSECFLYGYDNNNVILNFVSENNPVMFLSALTSQAGYKNPTIDVSKIVWQTVFAIILYALTLVLYKKRRIETAEDVAAYKCLNPIYKYLLCFMGAIITFAILEDITADDPAWVLWIVFIVSTAIYFAAEMVLKKTFKVWKKAFKGYVTFFAGIAIIFGVFSLTNFFGYESYVPNTDKVKSVSVFSYYYQNDIPMTEDDKLIEYITSKHTELTQSVPEHFFAQNETKDDETRLHIQYALENGSKVRRVYNVSYDESHKIMGRMYENADYKKDCEEIFMDDIEKIYDVYLKYNPDSSIKQEHYNDIVECIKKDTLTLSYDELHPNTDCWSFGVSIEYVPADNGNRNATIPYSTSITVEVNANYTNTINWLKENGYIDTVKPDYPENQDYYLCNKASFDKLQKEHKSQNIKSHMPLKVPKDAIKLDGVSADDIENLASSYKPHYIYSQDKAYVIGSYNNEVESFSAHMTLSQKAAGEFAQKAGVTLP